MLNLQDIYTSRVNERAKKITLDPTHTAQFLFELLPSSLNRYNSNNYTLFHNCPVVQHLKIVACICRL